MVQIPLAKGVEVGLYFKLVFQRGEGDLQSIFPISPSLHNNEIRMHLLSNQQATVVDVYGWVRDRQ